MRSTRAYHEITAKPITPRVSDWINDLEQRFGDDRVADAMAAVAEKGELRNFLGQVRDRLAKEDALHRPRLAPRELEPAELLAVVRGEISGPPRPWVYDTRDLTASEYAEVLAWSNRRTRSAGDQP